MDDCSRLKPGSLLKLAATRVGRRTWDYDSGWFKKHTLRKETNGENISRLLTNLSNSQEFTFFYIQFTPRTEYGTIDS